MSWQSINKLIGLAVVDEDFCQQVLTAPVEAAAQLQLELSEEEAETLRVIHAEDIHEFCQQLLESPIASEIQQQEEY